MHHPWKKRGKLGETGELLRKGGIVGAVGMGEVTEDRKRFILNN